MKKQRMRIVKKAFEISPTDTTKYMINGKRMQWEALIMIKILIKRFIIESHFRFFPEF